MQRKNWWDPQVLAQAQEDFRRSTDVSELDPNNDFGSYRRLLLGDTINNSGIALHNDLRPLGKVQTISRLLPKKVDPEILDAGCGLGFTTAALAAVFPKAKITGVDLSIDAIDYAKKTHKGVEFEVRAIEPSKMQLGSFDFIFCFEFYPFTRNRDVKFQSEMLHFLTQNLQKDGTLLICQTWREVDGLPKILKQVEALCADLNFVVRHTPHPRIATRLPWWIALTICEIGQVLSRKELVKKVVLVTKQAN